VTGVQTCALPISSDNEALVPVNYRVTAKLATGINYGASYSTSGNLNPRYRYVYSRTAALIGRPSFATQSFTSMSAFGGPGYVHKFILSTFSQNGINIVESGDNVFDTSNFGSLAETLNHNILSYGYFYYQLRTSSTQYDTRILFSTYYQTISSTQSYMLRYRDTILQETDGPNLFTDTAGFALGTNSTVGAWTIDQYYYP
jgi:hypothetical protein